MIIQTFETGPVRCNCSIVGCSHTREALIVDPGGDAEEIIARVKDLGLNVRQILITHGHFDHVLAGACCQKGNGCKNRNPSQGSLALSHHAGAEQAVWRGVSWDDAASS